MVQLHVPRVQTHPTYVSQLESWEFGQAWRPADEERVENTQASTPVSGAAQPRTHTRREGVAAMAELGASDAQENSIELAAESSLELAPPSEGPSHDDLVTLIAPSRVASAFAVREADGPAQTAGPAGRHATGGIPTLATEADVETRLGNGLHDEVMRRPWLTQTHPRLVERPDGTRVYRSSGFTATIRPDGSVDFAERDAIDAEELLQTGTLRFDLTDMAMRGQGQDPYAAERAWFMDETEELRATLERAHAERVRAEALRRVPGRLASIWNRTTPATMRRRALFRLWDDCEEEGDGVAVRAQVIAFVRETIPAASEDAFTVEELRRWNAERESEAPFAPY